MSVPVHALADDGGEHGSTDDATLVARICAGDEAAFDTLVLQYFATMVGYAATLVESRDDAEDVAQGVLARLWRLRAAWRVTTTIKTYLLSAVRNEAANRRRTERAAERREAVLLHEAQVRAGVWGRGEEAVADRDQVATLIEMLPARRREAIVLRYGMGLTYAEIGRVMGMTTKAAEQLVLRTIGTLRQRAARAL
jgi:RNA polymerase sigma-70 factor (ECF subfamily)